MKLFDIYITIFVLSFLMMHKSNRRLYLYTLYNSKYFLWLFNRDMSLKPFYKITCLIQFIVFIFIYPMLSIINPNVDFSSYGEFIVLPISLQRDDKDYELTKSMQNKLYWYKIFKKYNINTPEVFLYFDSNKIIKINDFNKNETIYIMKPVYGTEGQNIKKITLPEFMKYIKTSKDQVLLQQYIKDCWTNNARNFRIVTFHDQNQTQVFFVKENFQNNINKIASNVGNGGIPKMCKNVECDFLTYKEQHLLMNISERLIHLHYSEFKIIPFIGWDVILSCDGPYLLEGNVGATMKNTNEYYKKYVEHMKRIYMNE